MRGPGRRGGDGGRRGSQAARVTIAVKFAALFGATDGRYEAALGSNILTDTIDGARTFAVGAGTVANALADADYAGKPSLLLTGSQYLVSNQPATFWPTIHNGAGGTLVLVHKATNADTNDRYLLTTCEASTGAAGLALLSRGPASNTIGMYLCNASGGSFGYFADPATSLIYTPTWLGFSCSTADGVKLRRKSTVVVSGPLTAPSAADPSRTLRIGGNSSANGTMSVRGLYSFRRVLTASEWSVFAAGILADCGV